MNKKQLIAILVCIFSCLLIAQAFASLGLDEASAKFTYKGKPIHPGLVQEFSSWISDPGVPTTISVDIAAPHRNEYNEDEVEMKDNGWVCRSEEDGSSFCYKWLGKLKNDLHVLQVADSGGGSGVFYDLFFVKFDTGEGYTSEGEKYPRLLMSIIRTYGLGDRYDGKVRVYTDKVIVGIPESKWRGGPIEKRVELKFP